MMTTPVTDRLRALRERAKLSLREMARRCGMATNTYGHYENPDRLKSPFLPMEKAILFADVLAEEGIPRVEVLALAGTVESAAAAEAQTPVGLREDAAPYLFREQPVPHGQERLTLRAVFGDGARAPITYRIETALPGLGLFPGDVVVADSTRSPADGELAVVGLGTGATTVRRLLSPWLVTGDPVHDANPESTDQPGVTVRFPVIGCIRGIA